MLHPDRKLLHSEKNMFSFHKIKYMLQFVSAEVIGKKEENGLKIFRIWVKKREKGSFRGVM